MQYPVVLSRRHFVLDAHSRGMIRVVSIKQGERYSQGNESFY